LTEITSEILFEKFELIECFKKDEHASVYLANHIYLGKKIILKVLNTKTIFDDAKVERFKREAKILAKLDDPNIIKVLDFGTFNEFFYISFEYFESKNLRSFIKDKSLSLEQKKKLIIQLFHGLSYAHQNQIIHRDIKPENILVNDKSELKIGDFGLALGLNDNFVTSQYSIVGTPCYMSPEQVQGGKLSAQSDLFSAGIVALELFTGQNPFLGGDVNQTISNLINYNEEIVESYLIALPSELQNVLQKLLAKQKNKRYNNAEDVLQDLQVPLSEIRLNPVLAFGNRKLILGITFVFVIALSSILLFSIRKNQNEDDIASIINTDDAFGSSVEQLNEGNENLNDENTFSLDEKNETISGNITGSNNEQILDDSEYDQQINDNNPLITFGYLFVECIPWAHVYIEDRRLETTPFSSAIDLRAGKYNIKLIHPDYPEYHEVIEIKTDETTNLIINLDTLHGYLSCDVFPWGDIYIGDKFLGQTPIVEPVKLSPGNHLITIKNPNFPDLVENINIIKQDTLILKYNLNEMLQSQLGSKNN